MGGSPVDDETGELENFDSLVEVVYRTTLPCRVDISVTREGLFAFGFNSWERHIATATKADLSNAESKSKSILVKIEFMNAFLALLYSNSRAQTRMVVSPDQIIYVGFIEDPAALTSIPSSARLAFLNRSNEPGTYNPNWSPTDDHRISDRIHTIRLSDLRAATDQMAEVMADYPADGLLMLDLFLRASKASQDYSYSSSLIAYWAIIEKLLGELWATYQNDNAVRNGKPFVTTQRRKRLEDSRTYTAAVIAEILSLSSYLDDELYDKIGRTRKTRNDWMHSLKSDISHNEVNTASRACERMFQKVRSLRINS